MVKILGLKCSGCGSDPWLGNMLHGIAKKKIVVLRLSGEHGWEPAAPVLSSPPHQINK